MLHEQNISVPFDLWTVARGIHTVGRVMSLLSAYVRRSCVLCAIPLPALAVFFGFFFLIVKAQMSASFHAQQCLFLLCADEHEDLADQGVSIHIYEAYGNPALCLSRT